MLFNRIRDISRKMRPTEDASRNEGVLSVDPHYFGSEPEVPGERILQITYMNYRGIGEPRHIVPDRVWFGATDRFAEKQWLLDAFDTDRGIFQTLAFSRIVNMDDTASRVFDGSPAEGSPKRLSVSG